MLYLLGVSFYRLLSFVPQTHLAHLMEIIAGEYSLRHFIPNQKYALDSIVKGNERQ